MWESALGRLQRFRGKFDYWRKLPSAIRTLLLTAALASAIVLAVFTTFFALRNIGFFANVIDSGMDQRLALNAGVDIGAAQRPTLLDFDDYTLAGMGDPISVPPQTLASVLGRLQFARPRLVFLDLDISAIRSAQDIATVQAGLLGLARAGIPVLLARDVLPGPERAGPGRFRETSFDDLVAHEPNLMWVGTKLLTGSDGVVRNLAIVESASLGSRLLTVPSATLATLLVTQFGSLPLARQALAAAVAGNQPCGGGGQPGRLTICLQHGQLNIDLEENNRIIYRMPWLTTQEVQSIPALPLVRSVRAFDLEPLTGHIVIIGSTAGFRDYAQTPLGRMPGPWIHANAIYAWETSGPDPGVGYLSGVVVVVPLTVFITLLMVSIILRAPKRLRATVRASSPFVVTALFWIFFQLFGAPSASIGLLAVTYVITALIALVEKRMEPNS